MKLYPASLRNAHDVEFRRNRIKNEIDDAYMSDGTMSQAELDKAEILADRLTDLLLSLMNSPNGRTAQLTGEQIGLYKETQAWAENARASARR